MSKRIAVVILNWNNRTFLEQFLPDVIKYSSSLAEIIVADNASTDDSISFLEKNFPFIKIIRNSINEGYTGGYNTSLSKLENEFFVLLNSDVRVTENWLEPLLKVMDENPDAGACQPKILSNHAPDTFEYAGAGGGFIDKYGYPFCRGRIFFSLEKDHGQFDDTIKVFWASGACMFIRSSVFQKLNGFDPVFFAHMEEIDLCWRMQREGHEIYYCGSSAVYHIGGGSLPKDNPRKTYLNFRNNLLMVYKNADDTRINSILRTRWFLDLLASLKFLFSGGWADFKAVWQARDDFYKLKSQYSQGFSTSKPSKVLTGLLIYPHCILWDYYLCGRKNFASLRWKSAHKK
jgi:GT2 family glycosyltransferase